MKQTISTDRYGGANLEFTWFDNPDDDGDCLLVTTGEDPFITGLTADEAMDIYVWLQGRLEAAGLL